MEHELDPRPAPTPPNIAVFISESRPTYPYVVWIISANFLLNEQGIYGDEKLAEQIREQRNKESGYNIRIV